MKAKTGLHFFVLMLVSNLYAQNVLYMPWRDEYYTALLEKLARQVVFEKEVRPCIFCEKMLFSDNDEESLLIKRYNHCSVFLNLYPYSKGHILIIPHTHIDSIAKLSHEIASEIMVAIQESITVLEREMSCTNFNVGINIGPISGASIPEHVHIHVVPRYALPDSFMNIVAHTTGMCWDMKKLHAQLQGAFNKIRE